MKQHPSHRTHRGFRHGRPAFTLAEVVVTTVLMGLVFVAALAALQTGTNANVRASEMSTALSLVGEVREWTISLPFKDPDPADQGKPVGPDSYSGGVPFVDDVDDLMGAHFSPPRSSQGAALSTLAGWSQDITLTWRDETNVTQSVTAGTSDVIYVNVVISHNGEQVFEQGWLVTNNDDEEATP